jgi:hypothetical protein
MKYVLLRRECPMQYLAEDVRTSSYLRADGKIELKNRRRVFQITRSTSVDRSIWYESMAAIRQRMR